MTTRADMLFIAEMSVRYHRRRAAFLDVTSSLMSLATVIGGAGAFLSLIGGDGTLIAKIATLILTAVGAIQVIFRIDTAAAAHKQWLKQFLKLLLDVRSNEMAEPSLINSWMRERYAIESECVSEMRALQADCYNRTSVALDLQAEPIPLRWWHRAFCQVWSFEGVTA